MTKCGSPCKVKTHQNAYIFFPEMPRLPLYVNNHFSQLLSLCHLFWYLYCWIHLVGFCNHKEKSYLLLKTLQPCTFFKIWNGAACPLNLFEMFKQYNVFGDVGDPTFMPSILFCNLKPLKLYCFVSASFTTTLALVGLEVVPCPLPSFFSSRHYF